MTILVTGASGFMGSNVCRRLSSAGHHVIGISRSGAWSCPRESQIGHPLGSAEIDLRDPFSLAKSVTNRPDVVIHLAAVLPKTFTGSDATDSGKANLRIDENVLLASREFEAAVVYASSTSVYGFGTGEIKTESSPPYPSGPYAAGKLASERIGKEILQNAGLPFAVLRISAPYGSDQCAETVMKSFVERALKGLPLLYHGTGSRRQDFIHITDVTEALAKAALLKKSGTYNICYGESVSMKELASLVTRCVPGCASSISPSGQEDPQEGVTAAYSIESAKTALEWQPRVSLKYGIGAWVQTRLTGKA